MSVPGLIVLCLGQTTARDGRGGKAKSNKMICCLAFRTCCLKRKKMKRKNNLKIWLTPLEASADPRLLNATRTAWGRVPVCVLMLSLHCILQPLHVHKQLLVSQEVPPPVFCSRTQQICVLEWMFFGPLHLERCRGISIFSLCDCWLRSVTSTICPRWMKWNVALSLKFYRRIVLTF